VQQGALDYNDILHRLKAFDLDAFDHLYTHSRERLFVYALSFLKDEEAARDLVQELFVEFWEKKIFLNVEENITAYLVRSVRNRCLTFLKTAHRHGFILKQLEHLETGQTAWNDTLEIQELGQKIESAIGKLPLMPARVFRMHYIDKLSYAEIAEQLGISPNTISNHMTKALKLLRENLKKSG
jgi:RNA polymerase sigma-70 factor (family 1)